MTPLFWTAAVLLGLTATTSAFFYALYLGSGEPVPLARARAMYRWSVVVVLATFNCWIFGRVIDAWRAIP